MTKERASDSEQVAFWRGAFGDEYRARNAPTPERLRAVTRFWARVLGRAATHGREPASILEVGANVGINLRALKELSGARLRALEPNDGARATLLTAGLVGEEDLVDGVAEAIELGDGSVDLAFSSGVLIHVHPDRLPAACRELGRVSASLVLIAEYFSARPEAIDYRGHEGKLFKCDFGSAFLAACPDWQVLDYGFEWKPVSGLDNLTWWLFGR